MRSFLLIGQSNAAGRGIISEAKPLQNDKLFVLRNGLWRQMYRPVNPDRSFSGVSFSETFAELYSELFNETVGIIPCADGGTSVLEWQPGEVLFDNAVNSSKLAMRSSTLSGILWHQGEADCCDDNYLYHKERLSNVINGIRKELNAENVPVLVGGLGDYLINFPTADMKNYVHINQAIFDFASETKNCAFVSAKGLTSNEDFLHFNTQSLIELGKRYFNEFLKLTKN